MILTERYKDQIARVLSCYDRVILQGTLSGWCYDKGMCNGPQKLDSVLRLWIT